MTAITELKKFLGFHENKETTILNQFIRKYVPAWRGSSVNTTPWCAAMINAIERSIGRPGNGKLNARSFLTYGEAVEIDDAQEGDIVVFSRGGSTWQGHVAYFLNYEKGKNGTILVKVLGGNQSDAVSIGWYPKSRLIGVRRPEELSNAN